MTDSRLFAGRRCFGLSPVLLTVCPHYESPTIMGRDAADGNMDIILAGTDLCYSTDRGQSAWPSLVWSGGTHPFAIPGVQRLQSFVPANYCSSRFYWLDLLLRLKLESTACCTKTFTNCNFRQGFLKKKTARESFMNFSPIPYIRAAPAARGASHQTGSWCLWLFCHPNHVFFCLDNLEPVSKDKKLFCAWTQH